MNHLPLIIKREYLTKIRNRSFIVMTFLSPLIMVAIIALIAYLTQLNNDKINVISVLDESGFFKNEFDGKTSDKTKFELLTNLSLSEAKELVKRTENYGLLYIPKKDNIDEVVKRITFYSKDSPSLVIMDKIEDKLSEKADAIKLKESGLDPDKIAELTIRVNAQLETFEGEKTSKMGSLIKLIFGGVAGYLLFMFIIIYGNMIMRSIIEEKTSRIIEIIISSVKPIQLMLGKIFGTTLAGLTQFLVWIAVGGVLLALISAIFGVDLGTTPMSQQQELIQQTQGVQEEMSVVIKEIYNLPMANLVIMFILFFVGGYLLYSSLYAAIGAAVDNETDTQQFMMPIIVPLMLAIYVGFFTVVENPHGTVSQVFSFIPLTSPVVMLIRIPFGVPIWQQLISVILVYLTFYFVVLFAAKIYRVGILMYGKKPSYKELYKWLKY